jgi:hypothetical protein
MNTEINEQTSMNTEITEKNREDTEESQPGFSVLSRFSPCTLCLAYEFEFES